MSTAVCLSRNLLLLRALGERYLSAILLHACRGKSRGRFGGLMRPFFAVTVLIPLLSLQSASQVCRLSVAGSNRARKVTGQIHTECPEDIIHSAPFGNWGVTSNFGHKSDGHQFDGWCHNSQVCDNSGKCTVDCTDGWYEWNSCTDNSLYQPPNCSLFNTAGCSEQMTTTGVNVHGTTFVDIPAACPSDSNGDGQPDQGGCKDVQQYASGSNFMSLYELDPVCCDELVQTVYFPEANLKLSCDVWGCSPAQSEWLAPSFWDSPQTPAKVFAELSVGVNWGEFVDTAGVCHLVVPVANAVSSASFAGPNLAPNSIGTLFGNQLAPVTQTADTIPLPTSMAGVTVRVTDSSGITSLAPLFYVSPAQINFLLPADVAPGPATVAVLSGDVQRSTAKIQVELVTPGIFAANFSGKGIAAAMVYSVAEDGTVSTQEVADCNAGPNSCVPRPVDLGLPTDHDYLILFGTGVRSAADVTHVGVVIGGSNAHVDFAGAQGQYVGLDQINILLPHELRGRGTVDVVLTVDSKPANTVQVAFR